MEIRYVGGGTLTTKVGIQARIWENIQFEEQMARSEERQRLAREASLAARARKKRAKARPKFEGFVLSDFEPKKRGIAWANRKDLGKLLAFDLSPKVEGDYAQWIVPRTSAVHVARKDKFDRKQRDRIAAFYVSADEAAIAAAEDLAIDTSTGGVSCGLYVAKPEGELNASWHWSKLVSALGKAQARKTLLSAMEAHELTLDIYSMQLSYGLVGRVTVQGDGLQWQHETAEKEIVRQLEEKDLAKTLKAETLENRSELWVYKRFAVEDAVKLGPAVSGEILEIFNVLVPVYEACIGK
jgi:hypothetical protein